MSDIARASFAPALRRPAGRARALARAGEDGRRQGALRSLPGALPDQPRQARRLRPLRQRRRRADADRHAGAGRQAGRRPGRVAGRARREAAGTAACVADAPVFVSGIGSTTTYPDYKPAPFIVASKHEGVDMVTVVTEGIFSYCSFKVKIDTDRYLGPEQATVRHRGEAVGHVSTIEYGSQFLALGGVHHLTGGSKKEGRVACDMMMALGNREPVELQIDGGAAVVVAADKPPIVDGVEETADARRLRLGDDRHLRAAVVRPGRRGGGGRRPHHRRALRAPGRQVPRHGAERHSRCAAASRRRAATSRSPTRARAGAAPTSPTRSPSSKAGMRSTARGPACAC